MPEWLQKLVTILVVILTMSVTPVACTYLVILYGEPGSNRPQKPQQIAAQNPTKADNGQRGTQSLPLFVEVIPTPKSEDEAAQDAADREEKAQTDTWLVRFTGLLFFVGVVQAIVFAVQARQLKATVEAMKEIDTRQAADVQHSIRQAVRAADAMERAASAMDESAWQTRMVASATASSTGVMRENAERQLRAYVSIIGGEIGDVLEGRILIVETIMTNHGQTPAKGLTHSGVAGVVKNPIPSDYLIVDTDEERTSGGVIHPGGTLRAKVESERPLTPQQYQALHANDDARITIYAKAKYEDIFGVQHETAILVSIPNRSLLDVRFSRTGPNRRQVDVEFVYNAKNSTAT